MNAEQGYLLRCPQADAATLQAMIKAFLPVQCWSFGGALLWDVQPTQGRNNLRAITKGAASNVDISGDFGHAFANNAELRWKRLDDGAYDVLLLTETPDEAQQKTFDLTQIAMFPCVVEMTGAIAMLLATPRELQEKQRRSRLDYKEYRTANGAAQFARYMGCREELVKEQAR